MQMQCKALGLLSNPKHQALMLLLPVQRSSLSRLQSWRPSCRLLFCTRPFMSWRPRQHLMRSTHAGNPCFTAPSYQGNSLRLINSLSMQPKGPPLRRFSRCIRLGARICLSYRASCKGGQATFLLPKNLKHAARSINPWNALPRSIFAGLAGL